MASSSLLTGTSRLTALSWAHEQPQLPTQSPLDGDEKTTFCSEGKQEDCRWGNVRMETAWLSEDLEMIARSKSRKASPSRYPRKGWGQFAYNIFSRILTSDSFASQEGEWVFRPPHTSSVHGFAGVQSCQSPQQIAPSKWRPISSEWKSVHPKTSFPLAGKPFGHHSQNNKHTSLSIITKKGNECINELLWPWKVIQAGWKCCSRHSGPPLASRCHPEHQ